jgi:hypothetical protein
VTLTVPAALAPWNTTKQLPVADRVQLSELRVPPDVTTVTEKVTVPEGVFVGVVVSVTVAVQVEV